MVDFPVEFLASTFLDLNPRLSFSSISELELIVETCIIFHHLPPFPYLGEDKFSVMDSYNPVNQILSDTLSLAYEP